MGVCAVVGGQFGSEGKGLIVAEIAKEYDLHIRVGAANAGHTLYTRGDDGDLRTEQEPDAGFEPTWEKHVMQQVPCAAYANPEALLAIGPGALISMQIFADEWSELLRWREEKGLPEPSIVIDPRAHVITSDQVEREAHSDLASRIGSTSATAREGIGVATADRAMRRAGCVTIDDMGSVFDDEFFRGVSVGDVPMLANTFGSVLLEGTQGTGLSITTGYFPYCTSRNTTAAGLLADCGIAPSRLDRTILVCRTFPIRVAGNSGPFYPDSREISWEDIGVDPESERTTVTKKVRRVATFSIGQVAEAVVLNGATEIAITFGDYMSNRLYGMRASDELGTDELDTDADADLLALVGQVEILSGIPVTMIGTGPHSVIRTGCGS